MAGDSQDSAYVVMTNPPEVGASHPVKVCFDEQVANDEADTVSFGYVQTVPLSKTVDL